MKKLLSIMLAGLMVLSLVACGEKAEVSDQEGAKTEVAEVAQVSNLVGSWTGMYGDASTGPMSDPSQLKLVFNEDGTGNLTYFTSTTDFEWEEADGKVTCTYLSEDFIETYGLEAFEATVDGDVLRDGHLYGFDFIVAKDGTAAADPTLYSEAE